MVSTSRTARSGFCWIATCHGNEVTSSCVVEPPHAAAVPIKYHRAKWLLEARTRAQRSCRQQMHSRCSTASCLQWYQHLKLDAQADQHLDCASRSSDCASTQEKRLCPAAALDCGACVTTSQGQSAPRHRQRRRSTVQRTHRGKLAFVLTACRAMGCVDA